MPSTSVSAGTDAFGDPLRVAGALIDDVRHACAHHQPTVLRA
jgi:hypothetical protein